MVKVDDQLDVRTCEREPANAVIYLLKQRVFPASEPSLAAPRAWQVAGCHRQRAGETASARTGNRFDREDQTNAGAKCAKALFAGLLVLVEQAHH